MAFESLLRNDVSIDYQTIVEHQVQRLERRASALNLRDHALFMQQFFLVLIGIFVLIGILAISKLLGFVFFVAVLGFVVYTWRIRRRLQKSIRQYNLLVYVKQVQLARLQLDWEHMPTVADEREEDHPFENDLDISGEHSLHRLLNTAVSDGGKDRLRAWLLNEVPDRAVIHERQRFVAELAPMTHFRDQLQCNSLRIAHYRSKLSEKVLVDWLEHTTLNKPPLYRILLSVVLTLVFIATVVLYAYGVVQPLTAVLALILCIGWSIATAKDRPAIFSDTAVIGDMLTQLNYVFEFLEKYPYGQHKRLKQFCAPFYTGNGRPSILLKKLRRIAKFAQITQNNSQGNSNTLIVAFVINIFIPWDATLTYQLAQLQEQAKSLLPQWIAAWYELEALCSLADFAHINADYTMPEILDSRQEGVVLSAQGLGHPLIAREHKVVNDVSFERDGKMLLITGSNMAGKSTFLRTLGINLCLAYAGAPVNARHMRLCLFELRCCIRVTDSVMDGYSYFYAEVRRLKSILSHLQTAAEYPAFVLIDEIFKGTNNRERLIGSFAYIYALAEYPCCGAITTHDLDLVKLADELPQIHNDHFREEVIDGAMVFDYKLRSGPCPTTNALKILQMEGLPITWKQAAGNEPSIINE